MDAVIGFTHNRILHKISHTQSSMAVSPRLWHEIQQQLDNWRNCANLLFDEQPSAQKFMDIFEARNKDQMMLSSYEEPCPLLRCDADLMIKHLAEVPPSTDVSADDLQYMSSTIERMLSPSYSLVDHEGRTTKTIYRMVPYYSHLKSALELRPVHTSSVPGFRYDVHYVDRQDGPSRLYAQAKGKDGRFFGLSASTSPSSLLANVTVVATFYPNPNHRYCDEIKKLAEYAAAHPNNHVKLYRNWKVPQGSYVNNSANWIVDLDGPDHVTIAAKVDLQM